MSEQESLGHGVNESVTDWSDVRRTSHNNLRRRTIAHINNRTTDLAPGPMLLDAAAYTDPVRHEAERRVLFRERPVLAALTCDLPEPGDTFVFDLVGPSILLVRSKAASREQDREFSTDIEAVAAMIEQGKFQPLVANLLRDLGCP